MDRDPHERDHPDTRGQFADRPRGRAREGCGLSGQERLGRVEAELEVGPEAGD